MFSLLCMIRSLDFYDILLRGQVILVTILTPKKQAWRKLTAEFKLSLSLQSLFSTKAPTADEETESQRGAGSGSSSGTGKAGRI